MYQNLIKKAADRMVYGNDKSWEMDIGHFDWGPGVGLYGIWQAYQATKDGRYQEALVRWADKHIGEAGEKRTINSAAPCLTLWELYKSTEKEAYKQVCVDTAEYLTKEAPLTVDGGLEHTVTEDVPGMKEQMWADTLFMACIFLARFGRDTKNAELGAFAVNQLKLHYQYLWDEEKELFFHGWHGQRRDHMSGVHWGRANAWILISTLEILEAQPGFAGCEEIIRLMKLHIEALCRYQREDGMFGTILDDEDSYDELSASAGIACGLLMAARLGYCEAAGMTPKEVQAVKEAGLLTCRMLPNYLSEDGSVTGVSTGTPIMADAKAYKEIARGTTLYGQALAVMAFCECEKLN